MLNDAALQQNGGGMAGADASDSEKLSVIVSYCRQLAALDDNDTPLEEIAASAKMFCSDLKERNPGGCDGCPQRDKIETPSWLWSLWCRSQRPYPNMPASVFDRAADNWTPLFAIADVIGGVWSTRVRDAAAAVGAGQNESRKVELLRDFRDIFNELDARPGHRLPQTLSLTGKLQDIPLADYGHPDRILSKEVIALLSSKEDRPWRTWNRGKEITELQAAKMLEDFEIGPRQVRIKIGGIDSRLSGYLRVWFEDAWARYLPRWL